MPARSLPLQCYMDCVARLGCLLCARQAGVEYLPDAPCVLHHPRAIDGIPVGAAQKAPDSEVWPVCPGHHRDWPDAVHELSHADFEAVHGVSEDQLRAKVERLVWSLFRVAKPSPKRRRTALSSAKLLPRRIVA